ncbi:MAG: ATP-binding cassette domain-containing protein [Tenericutes bacterium]|nr:ATP-binding cassette domain-containing protein [Mycoplasmatota bacterium]
MSNIFDIFRKESKKSYPSTVSTKDSVNGRDILLEVRDVDVFFGAGKHTVKACNSLNFKIYTGETFGLVGESGSGKTTISRAILGINKLTNGAIYFKGEKITGKLTKKESLAVKSKIQMIFQDPAASLNERANVDYIISEGLYNFKMYENTDDRLHKVTDMLHKVSLLPEHLSRYPHEFSGGQRQRIGIARALIIEPELVLADEPISSLDVSIRAQVLNLLKKLQRDNDLTYLFVAHDLSIIKYISDRVAVMNDGYIVELGNANDIYSNPIHPYTKSLLTAIPQPDPRTKNDRKKLVYNRQSINYEECEYLEVSDSRFVLGTPELIKQWTTKQ